MARNAPSAWQMRNNMAICPGGACFGGMTMRLQSGITFKLFLTLFATCIVVILAMGAAIRYSFDAGFRSYIQQREERKREELNQALVTAYEHHGNWEFLRSNSSLWLRLQRASSRNQMPHHERGNMPPPPPPPLALILLDENRELVAGERAPSSGTPLYPIRLEGRTIGWLAVEPPDRTPDAPDNRFQREQTRTTWVILGLSLLLAALVSMLLARSFLAPVQRIARATHRLAAGDYAIRIEQTSRDELGQLALDFNRLAQALEKNERLRRQMMADLSHEIRTPLAILRGELEAMQDGVRQLTPATIASMHAEVTMLNKLIDDLHEFSLADLGALSYRMHPVDLAGLADTALAFFGERLASSGLRAELLAAPNLPAIEGDAQRLTQLLNNLLENSMRYTDPGGLVRVRLEQADDEILLTVEDSAPGVPEEALPHLFERLYRVESSRNRNHGGAGLGLALCERIVHAHHGRITSSLSDLGGLSITAAFPIPSQKTTQP
nr:sensor histidine kinase efflux regulator BaeS [Kerstersia gyiorum]